MKPADYNLLTDFAPISQLERSPNVLVVQPSLKVNSVKELIVLAQAKPGALLYGTGNAGGSLHVAAEMGGGSEVVTGTPEQLAAKLKSDDAKMRKLFKQIGLSADK